MTSPPCPSEGRHRPRRSLELVQFRRAIDQRRSITTNCAEQDFNRFLSIFRGPPQYCVPQDHGQRSISAPSQASRQARFGRCHSSLPLSRSVRDRRALSQLRGHPRALPAVKDPQSRGAFDEHKFYLQIVHLIGDLRSRTGLSQIELAKRAGVNQPIVVRLEKGDHSRTPTFDTIFKVLRALG